MTFRVGERVVCVDAKCHNDAAIWALGAEIPVEGRTYTISRSNFTSPLTGDEIIGIEELHTPYFGYKASRFRPLITRKTDISIFTEILCKVGGKVDA